MPKFVCKTLNLREEYFFGLRYKDVKGDFKWVKLNKKLSSAIKTKEQPFNLELKVKFYPEEASEELFQDVAQAYVYAQVRDDILSEEIYCPPATALLLASYQAHIQIGPYDPTVQRPGFLDKTKFLPQRMLVQFECSDQDWEDKIVQWYKKHNGMFVEDAIMEYLKIAQDLEMYGVAYFKIKNRKERQLWLGIDSLGLNVYPIENKLTPELGFPWSEIKNLSYRDTKFFVKPTDSSADTLFFLTESARASKEILALCLGNHDMYRVRRSPDSIERQQMKAQAKQAKLARDTKRDELMAERRARELLEKKCQENEAALEQSRKTLIDYEHKFNELEDQMTKERSARLDLEQMQRQMEELTRQMEHRNETSAEEYQRLKDEHDALKAEIADQTTRLSSEEANRLAAEIKLAQITAEREQEAANGTGNHDLAEVSQDDRLEEDREAMQVTDANFAQRLDIVKAELNAIRDSSKLDQMDKQYEANMRKGMDKYKTLRAIRQGNTKKRVDHFESM